MQTETSYDPVKLARLTGLALLASIVIGIAAAILVAHGIDINLNADVEGTAQNMLEAESRLRAKAYISVLTFTLEVFITLGLFVLLSKHGRLTAAWSGVVSIVASTVVLMGAVYTMNAAELAGDVAYSSLTSDSQRLMLTGLQATSDYTSFHLGLVMNSLAMAGFFYLFLISGLIPRIIAGWGLFASLLVAFMIVTRDFIPALGHSTLTMGFMLANLIAIISTGLYLSIKGVRQ